MAIWKCLLGQTKSPIARYCLYWMLNLSRFQGTKQTFIAAVASGILKLNVTLLAEIATKNNWVNANLMLTHAEAD